MAKERLKPVLVKVIVQDVAMVILIILAVKNSVLLAQLELIRIVTAKKPVKLVRVQHINQVRLKKHVFLFLKIQAPLVTKNLLLVMVVIIRDRVLLQAVAFVLKVTNVPET